MVRVLLHDGCHYKFTQHFVMNLAQLIKFFFKTLADRRFYHFYVKHTSLTLKWQEKVLFIELYCSILRHFHLTENEKMKIKDKKIDFFLSFVWKVSVSSQLILCILITKWSQDFFFLFGLGVYLIDCCLFINKPELPFAFVQKLNSKTLTIHTLIDQKVNKTIMCFTSSQLFVINFTFLVSSFTETDSSKIVAQKKNNHYSSYDNHLQCIHPINCIAAKVFFMLIQFWWSFLFGEVSKLF